MAPAVVKAFRIRKRHLITLILIVFLLFFLSGLIEEKNNRQTVAVMSLSLANKAILVDPGHGGYDPGVVGKGGVLEKDITLTVAKRLAANLGQAGAMVLMTRETDTDLSDPGTTGLMAKKREDLKRRVALANDNKADLYISIHVNSFPSPNSRGAQCFVQPGSTESKKAAMHIQSELARLLNNTDRQPKEVDYFITRNTLMPTVIVETGFITNGAEEKLLQDEEYQSKLAWAIYAGVVKYFAQEGYSSAQSPAEKERVIKTFKEELPEISKP